MVFSRGLVLFFVTFQIVFELTMFMFCYSCGTRCKRIFAETIMAVWVSMFFMFIVLIMFIVLVVLVMFVMAIVLVRVSTVYVMMVEINVRDLSVVTLYAQFMMLSMSMQALVNVFKKMVELFGVMFVKFPHQVSGFVIFVVCQIVTNFVRNFTLVVLV
jgi:hypothetical protein